MIFLIEHVFTAQGQARITFNSQEKTEAVLFELRTAMVFDGYTFSL